MDNAAFNDKKNAASTQGGFQSKNDHSFVGSDCNSKSQKHQYKAFRANLEKGVSLTQSIKEDLKNKFFCRYDTCYGSYVCPIAHKEEVQSWFLEFGLGVDLVDVVGVNFDKSVKVNSLEVRLMIILKEINDRFKDFISEAHKYDPEKSYQEFYKEPDPRNPDKENDDLRLQLEWDLFQRSVKIQELEKERDNLISSLDLHIECEEEWSAPKIIDITLPEAPQFNAERLLPEPLRTWMLDEAYRMPCSPDYIASTGIVSIGSIIGTRCVIRPKSNDSWEVVPNLWGGDVGPPGSKKTPAINAGLAPLEKLTAKTKGLYANELKDFKFREIVHKAQESKFTKELRDAANKNDEQGVEEKLGTLKNHLQSVEGEPLCKRYKTNDSTVAKLGELLRDNPEGILVHRDELVGLLSYLDQEGHEGDRAFYLEGANGQGSFDFDRIGRGNIFIPNVCISVFGGIQPDKLVGYLKKASHSFSNDGLLQRFQVLVYPEACTWEWRNEKPNKEARLEAFSLFEKLASLNPLDYGAIKDDVELKFPFYKFDDEAQAVFEKWSTELHLKKIPKEENPLIAQHLEKYDKLFPALSLIFHLIDCVVEDRAISAVGVTSAQRAMEWCNFLEAHARRCYGLLADYTALAAQALCQKLREGKLENNFTARDVCRKQWKYLVETSVVQEALEIVEASGWVRSYESGGKGPGSGRKTIKYLINPYCITFESEMN